MQTITELELRLLPAEYISDLGRILTVDDISMLVAYLEEKDNNLRYRAFLLLQVRSKIHSDVYGYWDELERKLSSSNSYQRSIGLMLIAENVRWDARKKMNGTLTRFLALLHDEKPITIRQCIQSLLLIVRSVSDYHKEICEALLAYDVMSVKESMRKLILMDILGTLLEIQKIMHDTRIDAYREQALACGMLDRKSIKVIEARVL